MSGAGGLRVGRDDNRSQPDEPPRGSRGAMTWVNSRLPRQIHLVEAPNETTRLIASPQGNAV